MKISVQTGGVAASRGLDKALECFKSAGFDAIDWNIITGIGLKQMLTDTLAGNPLEMEIDEVIKHYAPQIETIKNSGIKVTQMHAPFPAYTPEKPQLFDYMIEVYKKLIIIADLAECKNLIIHGICMRSDHPEDTEEYIESLNLKLFESLIPTLIETNVNVCLENLFTWRPCVPYEGPGHCSNADKAVEIIDHLNRKAGKECFGLCFDTGHANLVGLDAKEYILKLGNRIKALHIHDNDGVTDLHLAPYTGTFNWASFCEGLKEINYKGDLSFETYAQVVSTRIPTELLDSWLKLIAECGKYFKSIIE